MKNKFKIGDLVTSIIDENYNFCIIIEKQKSFFENHCTMLTNKGTIMYCIPLMLFDKVK